MDSSSAFIHAQLIPDLSRLILRAEQEAITLRHAELGLAHVLQTVIASLPESLRQLLIQSHVEPEKLQAALGRYAAQEVLSDLNPVPRPFSADLKRFFLHVHHQSMLEHAPLITFSHILHTLLMKSTFFERICAEEKWDLTDIRSTFETLYGVFVQDMEKENKLRAFALVKAENGTDRKAVDFLKKCGSFWVKKALQGELDPVFGREDDLSRMILILSRRTKHHPLLIGEPGVGKTAVVEALASAIAERRVPEALLDKEVFALDLGALLSGTSYRGQFEEKVGQLLNALNKQKNMILFIDEIHQIVGAGRTEGGNSDLGNLLKPILARGEILVIGATTFGEYRKSIEADGALARRFQVMHIEPPTPEETVTILSGLRRCYESFHHVRYPSAVLPLIVDLADRYMLNRYFPDKAIDLMDEAGALAYVKHCAPPEELLAVERQIEALRTEKQRLQNEGNAEACQKCEDDEIELCAVWENLSRTHEAYIRHRKCVVTERDVREAAAGITHLPVGDLEESLRKRLLNLNRNLKNRIKGQNPALDILSAALIRAYSPAHDPQKPLGVFLLAGPSGTGKTYLASVLAREQFDNDRALIRLDMNTFSDKMSVSRLTGAAPGYVGYGVESELAEPVRRSPHSIVLLDEIEKAHPDVLNVLLRIFDEGKLYDANHRLVDFRHCVFLLSGNIGTDRFRKGKSLSLAPSGDVKNDALQDAGVVEAAARAFFKPEFMSRINAVLPFTPLQPADYRAIAAVHLQALMKRLLAAHCTLDFHVDVERYFARKIMASPDGVRALDHFIETDLENPLADLLLKKNEKNGAFRVVATRSKLKIESVDAVKEPILKKTQLIIYNKVNKNSPMILNE